MMLKSINLFIVLISLFWSFAALSVARFDSENFNYKTGQIIAISETNYDASTFFFESFTGSRYGHIGIIVVEDGEVMVYEGNPPHTQKNHIEEFLDRSLNDDEEFQATVMKVVPALTSSEKKDLVAVVKDLVKKKIPYNFRQTMNEDSLNCSEFVYKSFKLINRAGIGKIETMNELNRNAFSGQLMRYWEMMTGGPVKDSSRFLSPASIVFSRSTQVIAANLPYDRVLSDKEMFKGWSTETALEMLDEQLFHLGNSEAIKNLFEPLASDIPYKSL